MTPRVPDDHLGFARQLRREMTTAEAMLWRGLRGRGIGAKFRRQVPLGPYVADFACVQAKIIVELDGVPHDAPEKQAHDRERTAWFARQGWRVLRFRNDLVITGGDLALNKIKTALGEPLIRPLLMQGSPSPALREKG